ncbi:hypothetical protein NP493_469g03018 [Ridgeia piscesae]|uniref:Uncharacterized protein n=1 Tax=Ridgeia piscesae TaxID=27915 RepID=A0AAD9NRM5_RIDPI|nr:hypothetical protein NP493_469g03018 [Ridgeia piscesae]
MISSIYTINTNGNFLTRCVSGPQRKNSTCNVELHRSVVGGKTDPLGTVKKTQKTLGDVTHLLFSIASVSSLSLLLGLSSRNHSCPYSHSQFTLTLLVTHMLYTLCYNDSLKCQITVEGNITFALLISHIVANIFPYCFPFNISLNVIVFITWIIFCSKPIIT